MRCSFMVRLLSNSRSPAINEEAPLIHDGNGRSIRFVVFLDRRPVLLFLCVDAQKVCVDETRLPAGSCERCEHHLWWLREEE